MSLMLAGLRFSTLPVIQDEVFCSQSYSVCQMILRPSSSFWVSDRFEKSSCWSPNSAWYLRQVCVWGMLISTTTTRARGREGGLLDGRRRGPHFSGGLGGGVHLRADR